MSRDMDETTVLENVYVVALTELAVLCRYENEEFWVPKSQILTPDLGDIKKGEEYEEFEIPKWLAKKLGVSQ